MTFCVISLFFLVSMFSSITAVDPTGLKVRITDRAVDVLKDLGQTFLEELVNKPFADFPLQWKAVKCTVKGLTLTRLTMDPAQVVLRFQENSGLQFDIKNLVFTGELQRDINLCFQREYSVDTRTVAFGGAGVSATIGVRLNKNQQGRLNVEIPNCVVRADVIGIGNSGRLGFLWDLLRPLLQYCFNNQLCPAVQRYAVPAINSMLESITMTTKVYEGLGINVDYSLSGDISVTSRSLDVPFKGLVFRQGDTLDIRSIRAAADPAFRDCDRMAYIGVSEIFFNSAAMTLYTTGAMTRTDQVTGNTAKAVLRTLQLFRQPSRLNDPLYYELKVTEVPNISITQQKGITVKTRARVRVAATNEHKGTQRNFVFVSATCQVNMKVNIKGNHLTLPLNQVSCTIVTQNQIRDVLVRGWNGIMSNMLQNFLQSFFDKGILIPLPEGVGFNQGKIDYHDGFVVIAGDLNLTPSGREKVVKGFGK